MQITLSDQGVLQKTNVHDGLLYSVKLTSSKNLDLLIKCTDNQHYKITIPKIKRLRLDNFWEGNIVFEIVCKSAACTKELLQKVYGYSLKNQPKHLDTDLELIQKGEWSFVQLSSSYGCDFSALSMANVNSIKSKIIPASRRSDL